MATTTNYGWTTPNDTDLVKDGAAAIRSLGQSIDTTFAELKGGTSGQMLTKASNTDNDYAWVTPEIGDITAVVADAPLTGGGTTGSVNIGIQDGTTTQKGAVQLEDSTASTSTVKAATPNSVKTAYDLANAALPKSTATTAGDILYRNGSAITRLPIGTAGQVLQVNTGATAPEWGTPSGGGGMTLLSTTSLSGTVTTVSSISQAYKELKIYVKDFASDSSSYLRVEFNSDTTGSNYLQAVNRCGPSGPANYTDNGTAGITTNGFDVSNPVDQFSIIIIPDYTNTTTRKIASSQTVSTTGGEPIATTTSFLSWKGTAAISQLVFRSTAGSFTAGTIEIYGVK